MKNAQIIEAVENLAFEHGIKDQGLQEVLLRAAKSTSKKTFEIYLNSELAEDLALEELRLAYSDLDITEAGLEESRAVKSAFLEYLTLLQKETEELTEK